MGHENRLEGFDVRKQHGWGGKDNPDDIRAWTRKEVQGGGD